jgi:hypothetical protein
MVALVYAKYLSEDHRSTVVPKSQVIAHSVKYLADFTRWEERIRGLSSLNSTSTIPNGTPLQSRASGSRGERYDVRNYWNHWQRWR